MFCPKCGKELSAAARFCPACGAPMAQRVLPAEPSVSDTKASVSNTETSASDTKASVSDTEAPVSNAKASASDTEASVSDTKASVSDTEASALTPEEPASYAHITLGLIGLLVIVASLFVPIYSVNSIFSISLPDADCNIWEFISLCNSIGSSDGIIVLGFLFVTLLLAIAVWSGSSTDHAIREFVIILATIGQTYMSYCAVTNTPNNSGIIESIGPAFVVTVVGVVLVILGGFYGLSHTETPAIAEPSSSGTTVIVIGILIMAGSLLAPLYNIPVTEESLNYVDYYRLCSELRSEDALMCMIITGFSILVALYHLHSYACNRRSTRIQLVAGAFCVILFVVPAYLYVNGKTEGYLGLAGYAIELGSSIYITMAGAVVVLFGTLF